MRRIVGILAAVVLLGLTSLLFPPTRALALGPLGDEVVVGRQLVLREGDRIRGDLVLIGAVLRMEPGSEVLGSVTAVGSNATIAGYISGDLVVLGADVTLNESAHVAGDVVTLGGRVEAMPGARYGRLVETFPWRGVGPGRAWRRFWSWSWRFPSFFWTEGPALVVWRGVGALLSALAIGLIAVVIHALWPRQMALVGETALQSPLPSLSVGCLSILAVAALSFTLLITICGAPLIPVLVVAATAVGLLGWAGLGSRLGEQVARSLNLSLPPPLVVGGGAFLLTLGARLVETLAPCLGGLVMWLLMGLALGAALLSRLGTTPYPPIEQPSEASG